MLVERIQPVHFPGSDLLPHDGLEQLPVLRLGIAGDRGPPLAVDHVDGDRHLRVLHAVGPDGDQLAGPVQPGPFQHLPLPRVTHDKEWPATQSPLSTAAHDDQPAAGFAADLPGKLPHHVVRTAEDGVSPCQADASLHQALCEQRLNGEEDQVDGDRGRGEPGDLEGPRQIPGGLQRRSVEHEELEAVIDEVERVSAIVGVLQEVPVEADDAQDERRHGNQGEQDSRRP
jgi:hypothetical protein